MMNECESTQQRAHRVLPSTNADELSRQEFVTSLKFHLASQVSPGNRAAYKVRLAEAQASGESAVVTTHHDVRRLMSEVPYFKFWSSLQRNSQEMMWRSTQLPVERQLLDLVSAASRESVTGGSLKLDPTLPIPRYHQLVDIHCMPGGYHSEFADSDVSAGAVYDRAVYLYAMGRMGPLNDDIGASVVNFVRRRFPNMKPLRILDLGCTVGHSTLPYVDGFPGAEVYGIDVSAPVLRYAHARAESLGKRVHFSQQNAEKTDFPDEHFDLIVSHILMHETSHLASRNIMREAHRLLTAGGVVIHAETPPYRQMEPFDAFMLDWDTRNNNEPYWGASHEIDPHAIAAECGFDAERAFEGVQPSAFDQAEAKRTRVFQGGDFGGGGAWYVYGAQKLA